MSIRGITFTNADMGRHLPTTLRIEGSHIVALGSSPASGDLVVSLDGDRLLPGLINAHDHLQLNHFPALQYDRLYRNAGEWIEDLNTRLGLGDDFVACRASPRDERLVLGGVKNLLSGATTVAHHDPLYPILTSPDYPIRVVDRYGWSHSLGIDGDEKVRSAHRRTPSEWPWIIHAAEGVDEQAAAEFERLDALGCLGLNTLLVHGVALDRSQRAKLAAAAVGLVWCPASNLRLFGATAEPTALIECGRVALGNDSRLTGARDLLDEIRIAGEVGGFDERTLETLVTAAPARLLRLQDRGVLRPGALADILVLPARMPLSRAHRNDVRLVMLGGNMRYGDSCYAEALLLPQQHITVRVDGREKVVSEQVGALLSAGNAIEPGVEVTDRGARAASGVEPLRA